MDRPAGSDALFIHTSEIDENSFERRKSSVLFNPELDYKESGETSLNDDEKPKGDEEAFESEFYFPCEARASIFSRISEMSLPIHSSQFKCFSLFVSTLIIFFLGFIVGTLATKHFLCDGFEQDKVNIWK